MGNVNTKPVIDPSGELMDELIDRALPFSSRKCDENISLTCRRRGGAICIFIFTVKLITSKRRLNCEIHRIDEVEQEGQIATSTRSVSVIKLRPVLRNRRDETHRRDIKLSVLICFIYKLQDFFIEWSSVRIQLHITIDPLIYMFECISFYCQFKNSI